MTKAQSYHSGGTKPKILKEIWIQPEGLSRTSQTIHANWVQAASRSFSDTTLDSLLYIYNNSGKLQPAAPENRQPGPHTTQIEYQVDGVA